MTHPTDTVLPDDLISPQRAGEILRCSRDAVRALLAKRLLTHYRLGCRVRVSRADVEEFARKSIVPADPDRVADHDDDPDVNRRPGSW